MGGVGTCECLYDTANSDPKFMDEQVGGDFENCLMEEVDNPCVEPAGVLGPSIIGNQRDCGDVLEMTFNAGQTCESDGNEISNTIPRGLTTVRATCPCSCRRFVEPIVTTDSPTTTEQQDTRAPEDLCSKMVDLTDYDGTTAQFTTRGYGNHYQTSCGGYGEERIFSYLLQPGESLSIRQSHNDYDSRHELSVGSDCFNRDTIISCVDDPDDQAMQWVNDRDVPTYAFFVVDAYDTASGSFTLTWRYGTVVTTTPTRIPT